MKKEILIILLSVIFTFTQLFAQKEASEKNNQVFLSLPRLAISNFSMTYEYLMQNNKGFALTGGVILLDNSSKSKLGGNFEMQYRFYSKLMRENVFQGIYFAPFIGYRYVDVKKEIWNSLSKTTIQNNYFSTVSGGIAIGCKIAIAQRIVFGFEIGGGVKYTTGNKEKKDYHIFDYGYSGITPRTDIIFGLFF